MPRRSSRFAAQVRHEVVLIARDPGPLIGYTLMPLLLIVVLKPMLGALGGAGRLGGAALAASAMAVMFALFALKTVGALLLDERTWHTWERLRSSPAPFGEILAAKALPLFCAVVVQQAILFRFAAAVYGLAPTARLGAAGARRRRVERVHPDARNRRGDTRP